MDAVLDALTAGGLATLRQLALLALPLALLAWLLRAVETSLVLRVQRRLGRRAVLATAWLGVPVHELSHAAACVLFGHRVERVRLFAPDLRTRTLGSVRHTWNPRNPWAQVGRFVIGIAPLLGGAATLWALAATLGRHVVPPADLAGVVDWHGAADVLAAQATELARALTRAATWTTWRTWGFLYLCLCIGAHLAPSGADLRGARAGGVALLLLWWATDTALLLGGVDLAPAEAAALALLAPLAVVLGLGLCLSLTALGVVWLGTAWLPERA